MYTVENFRTKKALKEAVKAGKQVQVFQYNDLFGNTEKIRQQEKAYVTLEGPHYPEPHRWYARVETSYGVITKVLG